MTALICQVGTDLAGFVTYDLFLHILSTDFLILKDGPIKTKCSSGLSLHLESANYIVFGVKS